MKHTMTLTARNRVLTGLAVLACLGAYVTSAAASDPLPSGWQYRVYVSTNKPNLTASTPAANVPFRVPGAGPASSSSGGMKAGAGALITQAPDATSTNLIPEMAQALQYNPLRIYEFVRNDIAYQPYYGLKKGPTRTLLDRSGNDVDQAWLLMQLLTASGYSPVLNWTDTNAVSLAAFPMSSPDNYDLPHWLGVSNNTNTVINTLIAAGFPGQYIINYTNVNYIAFEHAWVSLTLGGTNFLLDPSFKPSMLTTGLNIAALCGYNRGSLTSVASAGASITTSYIQNLNTAGITNTLNGFVQNLHSSLSNNYPNASFTDIVGGQTTVQESLQSLPTLLHFYLGTNAMSGANVPQQYAHWLTIEDSLYANNNPSYQTDLSLIGNHKLWFTFKNTQNPGTTNSQLEIYQDNTLVYLEPGGSTFPPTSSVVVVVGDFWSNTFQTATYTLPRISSNTYVVALGFGADGSGQMVASAFGAMQRLTAAGVSSNDQRMISAGLQVIGQSWLQESDLYNSLEQQLSGDLMVVDHRIGIVAQETNTTAQVMGYYVDLRNQFDSVVSVSQSIPDVIDQAFQWSAMEHGVLEQIQHANRPAVSTIKLLHQENLNGRKIFLATSNNWASVAPQLSGYGSTTNTLAGQVISGNSVLLLPQDATISLTNITSWVGSGWVVLETNPASTQVSIAMLIGGAFSGGYELIPNALNTSLEQTLVTPSANSVPVQVSSPHSSEPVDLQSGAYLNQTTDLKIDGPMGIQFTRYYNSQQCNRSGPLGFGWTHSLNIYATQHSDVLSLLGGRAPQDALAALVAAAVNKDICSAAAPPSGAPLDWGVAVEVADWAMSQWTDHSVSLAIGDKSMTFDLQPDGIYTPPPGVTTSLTGAPGSYVAQERNANTYTFNTNNLLDHITDPDSNVLQFSYDNGGAGTNLTQVSCSSFRSAKTMHFNYAGGGRLSSVADDVGTVSFGYSSAGDLNTVTDPASFTWSLGYDGNHHIISLTDPQPIMTISNLYNSADQVTNQISASGQPWNYYTTGEQTIEQSPLGLQTTYSYDNQARLTSVQTADGGQTFSSYDGQDHVVQTVDALGVTNVMVYDGNNNLISVTNAVGRPEQRVTVNVYDNQNQLSITTNAASKPTKFSYNPEHHLTLTIDALGNQQSFTYGSTGLKQSYTVISAGGVTLSTGTYTYDGFGFPLSMYLTDSGTTSYTHDGVGDLLTQKDPLLKLTSYAYDPRRLVTNVTDYAGGNMWKTYYGNGLLKLQIDPRGFTNSYTYAPTYKPLTVTAPDGGVVSNAYDIDNRLVTNWSPRTFPTAYYLDAMGRVTNQISALSHTTQTGYDLDGNVISSVDAVGDVTSNQYDGLNQVAEQFRPLGSVFYSYDPLGKVTNTVDELTRTWRSQYDALERLTRSYRPSGAYEQYSYDGQGNRIGFVNADNHPMGFGFDSQSRLKAVTNALNQVISYVYDGAGNLTTRIDALNRTNSLTYDALNRLTNSLYADGTFARLGYDADSNIATSQTAQSMVILGYESCDRLSSVTGQIGSASWLLSYGYDKSGNVTNLVYPGSNVVSYVYDAEERLTSVTDWNHKTTTFNYDNAGRLTGVAYGNGGTATFGYDSENRVTSLSHTAPGGSNFVSRAITRNAVGYKIQENINAGLNPVPTVALNKQQSFDPADRLLSSTDQHGNVTTNSFDADGNVLSSASPTSTVSYVWDCADRLASITNGSTITSFLYDGQGNRVGRISGTTTNYFVLNYRAGLRNVLAELDATGHVTRYYIWGPAGLVCHIDADGITTHYYHADEEGSTLALTDGSGNVSDRFAYSPYGELSAHIGTNSIPYEWLGGAAVRAEGTNTYAMLRRFYSADQKRFLSSDPSGIDSFPNLYAYGNINPVFYIDPTGLYPVVIVFLPNGTVYMPLTAVKNMGQAQQFGFPIGTAVPIAVPPNINPQTMVDSWSSKGVFSLGSFASTWQQNGPNDYKRRNPMYDAYGNFEYGATGASAGYPAWLLQGAATAPKTFTPGGQNSQNTADIQSGYNAIANGGTLTTVDYVPITPPSLTLGTTPAAGSNQSAGNNQGGKNPLLQY